MNLREHLHDRFRDLYFGTTDSLSSRLLRGGLVPFVPLYSLARDVHQKYRRSRARTLSVPVVSVGNLSVGGTGKTAFVLWAISELLDRGLRIGVLKRGEGEEEGLLTGDDDRETDEIARLFGDELALYRYRYPGVPVGVGVDRFLQGRKLLDAAPVDLLLMDDGFQYTKLTRDRDLVLLDSLRELDAWQLPAGPLREPVSALDRADWISVRGSDVERQRLGNRLDREEVLSHRYRFAAVQEDDRDRTNKYRDRPFQLITTLARPGRLTDFLRDHDLVPARTVHRPDHDSLDPAVLRQKLDEAPVLMTQKEWVKLPVSLQNRVGVVSSELEVRPARRILNPLMALARPGAKKPGETPGEDADGAQ